MFLMAIPGGSVLPEWWLSKSGLLAQTSPEYSHVKENSNLHGLFFSILAAFIKAIQLLHYLRTLSAVILCLW